MSSARQLSFWIAVLHAIPILRSAAEAQAPAALGLSPAALDTLAERVALYALVRVRTGNAWQRVQTPRVDSTLLRGVDQTLELSHVDQIQYPRSAAKDGLLGGALLGGFVGAVLGGTAPRCDLLGGRCVESTASERRRNALRGAAELGLYGGLIGLAIGSLTHRWSDMYHRRRPAAVGVQPVGTGGIEVVVSVSWPR